MTVSDSGSAGAGDSAAQTRKPATGFLPRAGIGWLGVALAAVAILALAGVLAAAGLANDPSAVNRSFMIGTVILLVASAVVSVLCVALGKQHSALNLLAAAMTVSALGLVVMLALGGFFNGVAE